MRCENCSRENPEGAKFCRGCGTSLSQDLVCSACATKNLPDSEFCMECGASLRGVPASTPAPQPAGLPSNFAGGRYQVQRYLGEGAKKRVYLARDSRLERFLFQSAFGGICADALDHHTQASEPFERSIGALIDGSRCWRR